MAGKGTIDWKQAMELLRSAPQTPPLMLELERREDQSVREAGPTFEKLKRRRTCVIEIW